MTAEIQNSCAFLPWTLLVVSCVSWLHFVQCSTDDFTDTTIQADSFVDETTIPSNWSTSNISMWTPFTVVRRAYIDEEEIVFRVINGQKALAGEFPYQLCLRKKSGDNMYKSFCGASILKPKMFISAAHCFVKEHEIKSPGLCETLSKVKDITLNKIFAVAGSLHALTHYHGDKDTTEHGQWRRLSSAWYPPDYNLPKGDIAIAFTKKPFKWTKLVGPIPLATKHMEYTGFCKLSGFGRINATQRNLIHAEILTGCGAGETVFIPRIPLIPNNFPFEFKRTQFPISLCFAMTINKSQGQTLKAAGVDLRSNCFSHGQLYVACSRVSSAEQLFVLAPTGKTTNVVYRDIL